MDHSGELGIRAVQIAGSEPSLMAEAAKVNVDMGAQIIDINMKIFIYMILNSSFRN